METLEVLWSDFSQEPICKVDLFNLESSKVALESVGTRNILEFISDWKIHPFTTSFKEFWKEKDLLKEAVKNKVFKLLSYHFSFHNRAPTVWNYSKSF